MKFSTPCVESLLSWVMALLVLCAPLQGYAAPLRNAPAPSVASPPLQIDELAKGLEGAWSLAFLPGGRLLVTQLRGDMRVIEADGLVGPPVEGLPAIKVVAAHGLHDVLLDPDFASNRWVYFTYLAPPPGEPGKAWPLAHWYAEVWAMPLAERRRHDLGMEVMARAKLSADYRRLTDVQVMVQGAERRIALARDGSLLVSGADRFRFYDTDLDGEQRDFSAEPDIRRNYSGSVLRIGRDGLIPADNPWLTRATVPPALYAHGLRDPEGLAVHPGTGEPWATDHGPQGGDEINIIRPGRDYGWPEVSYGVQYDANRSDGRKNVPVGTGLSWRAGVEEPVYVWVPSIAPSGMMFYTGDRFPQWRGNLFVGALAGKALVRLVLDGERVVAEERLLHELDLRVRDVRQGPDGSVYVLAGDRLLRLTPKPLPTRR